MVVVQAGKQGATSRLDRQIGAGAQRADGLDDTPRTADVDAATLDLRVADDQRRCGGQDAAGQATTGTSAIAAAISASGSS